MGLRLALLRARARRALAVNAGRPRGRAPLRRLVVHWCARAAARSPWGTSRALALEVRRLDLAGEGGGVTLVGPAIS